MGPETMPEANVAAERRQAAEATWDAIQRVTAEVEEGVEEEVAEVVRKAQWRKRRRQW